MTREPVVLTRTGPLIPFTFVLPSLLFSFPLSLSLSYVPFTLSSLPSLSPLSSDTERDVTGSLNSEEKTGSTPKD